MKLRNKKTGYICDFLGTYSATPYFGISVDYHNGEPISYEYNSLAELNEVWEDYAPQEPLIEDSEVYKIVRDWYEYHATDMPIYCEDDCTLSIAHTARIEFLHKVFRNLEQNHGYGITELCGEEE